MQTPLKIRMHADDNVAIVANDGGLPAGTQFESGRVLLDKVPQGHKVALVDIPQDAVVRRYDVPIGYALKDIRAGSWVHERRAAVPRGPRARRLAHGHGRAACRRPARRDTPSRAIATPTVRSARATSSRSRTTVQCVAGVVTQAVARIKAELLPDYPNVDDVVALEHGYGCGVAIDAPDAIVPIRTLRHT